jgi:TetR/AcrR family transcriptional repressor of nem operon
VSPKRAAPVSTAPRARPRTADRILDAAERLAQTRGFNGFSYADVSDEVGITTASLHYHFPGKAHLGRALIDRYIRSFGGALAAIEAQERTARGRLDRYARLYADVLSGGRMCLCGMLAAEYATLPSPMQRGIREFFDANEAWLSDVLEQGRSSGELSFDGAPRAAAQDWASTLEGAMLLARPYGDPARLLAAARRLLQAYRGARP